jgi:hypothetical protein
MINRRDFLKLSGVALVALGSGAGLKKLLFRPDKEVTLAALLPDDNMMLAKVLNNLTDEAGISLKPSTTMITGEGSLVTRLVKLGFSAQKVNDPKFIISISRIATGNEGDIFVHTDDLAILKPETGFSNSLRNLRQELKSTKASLLVSIRSISENDSKGERFAVIESEGKKIEKLSIFGEEKEISVYGGNIIAAGNGRVYVKHHGCKRGICRSMGHISVAGDVIACAPHQTMISIVKV